MAVMKVRDLRVLITGAASGAGRTIVETLANGGAKVFVSDISEVAVADLSNARPDILVIQTDVSNEAQIDDMFTRAEKHLGGLDVLINNAGIAGPTMAAESIPLTDWARNFDVNVTGHWPSGAMTSTTGILVRTSQDTMQSSRGAGAAP
jgi:NAD(P)-dependent dehydrogenase (short-subunit alcohol dehydrogenase family)